jgi:ketosteroid isomerase-like protein
MSHHIGEDAEAPPTPPLQQALIQHYAAALGGQDLDIIANDYADDAVVVTQRGVVRGRPAIRTFYERVLNSVDAPPEVRSQSVSEDVLLLGWTTDANTSSARDGVDTFVIRGGAISMHTTGFDFPSNG